MRIYYSTLCKIGSGLSETVDEMIRFGGDGIELMLDGGAWDGFENRGRELAAMLRARPAAYTVHMPVWDINLTSENAQARKAALRTCEDSIAFASLIRAEHVVLHPGFCYAPVFDKRAARAVEELCRFDEAYGVPLLVENVGNASTSIFTEREFARFIEGFGGKVGCLLDIGHANFCGWEIAEDISRLRPFLDAVHLHDNGGDSDSHLPIGEGGVPWDAVFTALKTCRPDLRLILEYDIGTPPERLQEGKKLLLRTFPAEETGAPSGQPASRRTSARFHGFRGRRS